MQAMILAVSGANFVLRVGILCLAGHCHSAQTLPMPKPAADYVVRAFDRYPLVALSEWHGAERIFGQRQSPRWLVVLIFPCFSGRQFPVSSAIATSPSRYLSVLQETVAS